LINLLGAQAKRLCSFRSAAARIVEQPLAQFWRHSVAIFPLTALDPFCAAPERNCHSCHRSIAANIATESETLISRANRKYLPKISAAPVLLSGYGGGSGSVP